VKSKHSTTKITDIEAPLKAHEEGVSKSPKQIFIVEDHPVFRQGLVHLINAEKDLRVCGQADNAEEALGEIARLKPDLALVDISLPGKSGLELIKEVRAVNRTVKLLVVSMHDEALYADRVLRAGGDGYIMKQEDPSEIIHAIRDILCGRLYVSEDLMGGASKAAAKRPSKGKARLLDKLTDEELEVLELLGLGKTRGEIARQLGVGHRIVAARCAEMRAKLNFKNDNELIRYAVCWVETGG
jgi:DNA-binding NarL/FixJ family response regulator